jgi:hypothetical protein
MARKELAANREVEQEQRGEEVKREHTRGGFENRGEKVEHAKA